MQHLLQTIAEGRRRQEVIQLNKEIIDLRRHINDKDATNDEQVRNNERVSCCGEEKGRVSAFKITHGR